jgi:ABC-type tungstate transport system permease subunit
MPRRLVGLFIAMAAVGALFAGQAQAATLNIWGTSDITDSGFLDNVITPGFASFDPSDSFTYTAVGSGAAITAAENPSNNIDVIVTHSPSSEAPFVAGGYSYEPLGRATFYNDYVIVGPTSDPAGVSTSDPHNAVGAFQDIAARGAAHGDVTFVSRNDNSGTNVKEQNIWAQVSGVTVQPACNAGGAASRDQPGTSCPSGIPSWYVYNPDPTPTQGNNLQDTNDCDSGDFPDGGCYTIVDRGTYYNYLDQGLIPNLKVVSSDNVSTAPGGLSELTNPFHAYIVNSSTQKAAATQFMNYLTSSGFQGTLASFPGSGQVAFRPDAYATISSSSITPTHQSAGSSVTITATLVYPPPVAKAIGGMTVELQSSSSSGGPWTNVSSTTSNATTGVVTFTPTIPPGTTTAIYYRLDMGVYDDTALASQFSPNDNQQLGTMSGEVPVP